MSGQIKENHSREMTIELTCENNNELAMIEVEG